MPVSADGSDDGDAISRGCGLYPPPLPDLQPCKNPPTAAKNRRWNTRRRERSGIKHIAIMFSKSHTWCAENHFAPTQDRMETSKNIQEQSSVARYVSGKLHRLVSDRPTGNRRIYYCYLLYLYNNRCLP